MSVPPLPDIIVATRTVRLDVARIVRDLTGAGFDRAELDLAAVLGFVETWLREDPLGAGGEVQFADGDGRRLEVELGEHGFVAS